VSIKLLGVAAGVLAITNLTACYKVTYSTNNPSAPGPASEDLYHNVIFGLVELSDPVPLNQICPNGFAKVHNEMDIVSAAITLGLNVIGGLSWLYQPRMVQVWCAGGTGYNVYTDDEGLAVATEWLGVDPELMDL